MVPYPSTLDVPHELVEHVSWLIYARRCEQGTRWRKLNCFWQALLALAHLRKNDTLAQLGAGFGISEATAWRYVDETVDVLAAWASGLREALAGRGEGDFVILDGTLIPTDRIAADEPYYSQKHKKHGMNMQVIAAPDGTPLWFSRALPGRTHDLTAARAHGVIENCLTRQILVLADRAYQGAGATVRTPYYRHHELPERYQQYNQDHARLRAPGERAFAQLKTWRLLRRARCSTNRIGRIVAAVHTLLTCECRG
ncbi:transposase family protein [Streptomyces sp. NPDC127166]|uniref:transposase family protein n=1 Tax=Streptomyces sp. NPDC127166 TaxID=3345380 RepID=UPI0036340055